MKRSNLKIVSKLSMFPVLTYLASELSSNFVEEDKNPTRLVHELVLSVTLALGFGRIVQSKRRRYKALVAFFF